MLEIDHEQSEEMESIRKPQFISPLTKSLFLHAVKLAISCEI